LEVEAVSEGASSTIYGKNPVLELLRSRGRKIEALYILANGRGRRFKDLLALARQQGVRVSFRTRDQLTAMAGTPAHQGVVCHVAEKEYIALEDLFSLAAGRGEPPFFLALDRVQDPRNLGSLLRTAEAMGVHGIVLPRHHAAGLTASAAKASMGALEFIAVARVTNLVAALEAMKKHGVWIYGTVPIGGVRAWEADLTRALCLVLGGEEGGVRSLVAQSCDLLLTLPMPGHIGSLNVGAAGAALCYEVVRQRFHKNILDLRNFQN